MFGNGNSTKIIHLEALFVAGSLLSLDVTGLGVRTDWFLNLDLDVVALLLAWSDLDMEALFLAGSDLDVVALFLAWSNL